LLPGGSAFEEMCKRRGKEDWKVLSIAGSRRGGDALVKEGYLLRFFRGLSTGSIGEGGVDGALAMWGRLNRRGKTWFQHFDTRGNIHCAGSINAEGKGNGRKEGKGGPLW